MAENDRSRRNVDGPRKFGHSDRMTEIPAFVPASKTVSLFSYIRARGIDPEILIERIESDPASWRDPETAVPLDVWLALNREAARALGDPDFGLGFGMYFWGMPTMLGHLMGACRDVGDAFGAFIRYQCIEHHSWRLSRRDSADCAEIAYEPDHSLSSDRLIVDFVLANLVNQAQRLTGSAADVASVHFAYPRPESASLYEKIFRCPIVFGDGKSYLAVRKDALSTPILGASESVRERLVEPLERELRSHSVERKVSARVAEAIARRRGGKAADAVSVASELGLGVRDLQAKLKAEGTTFHELRESFLREMALGYLREGTLGLKEISFLLGFSEPSAFHRAFVRWTGQTPGEARGTRSVRY